MPAPVNLISVLPPSRALCKLVATHEAKGCLLFSGKEFIARSWCWNRYVELTKLTKIENNNSLKRHAISFTKHLPGGSKFRGSLQSVKNIEALAENVATWLKNGSN